MENQEKIPKDQGDLKKKIQDRQAAKLMVVNMGMEFAGLILGPLLIFVFLERKFNPGHRSKAFLIIGFFLSLAVSVIAIGKRINEIRKRLK